MNLKHLGTLIFLQFLEKVLNDLLKLNLIFNHLELNDITHTK